MNSRRSHATLSKDARPNLSPLDVHVLDGAAEIPDIEVACLGTVARILARHGKVLIVSFDDAANAISFHEQAEWIPAGLHAAARNDRSARDA